MVKWRQLKARCSASVGPARLVDFHKVLEPADRQLQVLPCLAARQRRRQQRLATTSVQAGLLRVVGAAEDACFPLESGERRQRVLGAAPDQVAQQRCHWNTGL